MMMLNDLLNGGSVYCPVTFPDESILLQCSYTMIVGSGGIPAVLKCGNAVMRECEKINSVVQRFSYTKRWWCENPIFDTYEMQLQGMLLLVS